MKYLTKRLDAIIVGVLLIAGFAFYQNKVVNPMYESIIERQNILIEKVTDIPRYSIQKDFGKTKAKQGTVNLNLDNAVDVENSETKQPQIKKDTIKQGEKQKFWDRIFRR